MCVANSEKETQAPIDDAHALNLAPPKVENVWPSQLTQNRQQSKEYPPARTAPDQVSSLLLWNE